MSSQKGGMALTELRRQILLDASISPRLFGESILLAAPQVVGGRVIGWHRGDVEFNVDQTFYELDCTLQDVRRESDERLARLVDWPTPRYVLYSLDRVPCGLRVSVQYSDWSIVSALQDSLFRHGVSDSILERKWMRSSISVVRSGRPQNFVHHLAVHVIAVTCDGFVVTCVRNNVSNQVGRLSLSCEEQLQPAYIGAANSGEFVRVNGESHPMAAVQRCLYEELGISVEEGRIELLGATLELTSIAFNLVAVAWLAESISDIHAAWRAAPERNEMMMLPPDLCFRFEPKLLTALGRAAPLHWPNSNGRWHASSRIRVLLALMRVYPISKLSKAGYGDDALRLLSFLESSDVNP